MDTSPIVLLPLDERPVNVQLPSDIARIAGTRLTTPPAADLPHFRTPGNTTALAGWLEGELATGHGDAIISLDMLVAGGLIPSRTSDDDLPQVLTRLDHLRALRSRFPDARLDAVGLVMRAPDTHISVEEPGYWPQHGRELHALGADAHRQLAADVAGAAAPVSPAPDAPVRVREDYSRRRLRNHMVNLRSLDLAAEGVLDTLAITADDTAEFSAGSAEQQILRHWARMLPHTNVVHMYPGADEVGATLAARAITRRAGITPRIAVRCADAEALQRIPSFENQPVASSIARQIGIVGATQTHDAGAEGEADAVLVVHGPAPGPERDGDNAPSDDASAAGATGRLLRDLLAAGGRVGLADIRYANGADSHLTAWLAEHGLLGELEAYSAWNTAGNSVGSALGLLVAATVGRRGGTLDEEARRTALIRRLLDDHAYQSLVRGRRFEELFDGRHDVLPAPRAEHAAAVIRADLRDVLESWHVTDRYISALTLPWNRSFEVEIQLAAR